MAKFQYQPQQAGYSTEFGRSFVTTKLDGGASRNRKDFIGSASEVNVTWIFDRSQFLYYIAFYQTTLDEGSLPFEIDLILDHPIPREYTCRFISDDRPSLQNQAGLSYTVTAIVEAEARPINDDYNNSIVTAVNNDPKTNTLLIEEPSTALAPVLGTPMPDQFNQGEDLIQITTGDSLVIPTFGNARRLEDKRVRSFDGTSYEIRSQNLNLPDADQTISFWFEATATKNQYVVASGNGTIGGLSVRFKSNGKIAIVVGNTEVESTVDYTLNTLTHFAVVYDSSADEAEIYLDGVSSETVTTSGTWSTGVATTIGSLLGTGQYYQGNLSDLRIYSEAISSTEVAELHNQHFLALSAKSAVLINWMTQDHSVIEWDSSGNFEQGLKFGSSDGAAVAETSLPTVPENEYGWSKGTQFTFGDNQANDMWWGDLGDQSAIPFDPAKIYRIRFVNVIRTEGTGAVFLGWSGYATNGTTKVNSTGLDDWNNQYFHATQGTSPTTVTTYTGYTQGTAATGSVSAHPNIGSPGTVNSGVSFLRPLIIANHNNVAGTYIISRIEIDVVDTNDRVIEHIAVYKPRENYDLQNRLISKIGWNRGFGGLDSNNIEQRVPPQTNATLDARGGNLLVKGRAPVGSGVAPTYTAVNMPNGVTIDPTTGQIFGRVFNENFSGFVTVTATNSFGSKSLSFQWTVVANTVIQLPSPNGTIGNREETGGGSVNLDITSFFNNPTTESFTYSAQNLPAGLTIGSVNGIITGTLTDTASTNAVTIRASVTQGFAEQSFQWIVVPSGSTPPGTSGTIADKTDDGGTVISFATASFFTNPGGSILTYSAEDLPAGLSINSSSGLVSGTLTNATSTNAVAITVTNEGGTATQSFTWQVNTTLSPPVFDDLVPLGIANRSDTANTSVSIAIAGFYDDPDSLGLTYSAASLPPGVTINTTTGVISGTTPAQSGVFNVVVTVSNSAGDLTDPFQWTIT